MPLQETHRLGKETFNVTTCSDCGLPEVTPVNRYWTRAERIQALPVLPDFPETCDCRDKDEDEDEEG